MSIALTPVMSSILAAAVFVATLAFVLARPRGINEAWPAAFGAAASLLLGLVSPGDVVSVLRIVWNASLSLISIVLISSILDGAGLFRLVALRLAERARGSAVLLLFLLALMTSVVTILFNNDGSILVMTPVSYYLLVSLGVPLPGIIAFMFTIGFIADIASLPLMVSNLVNIINADYAGMGFIDYIRVSVAPGIVAILSGIGLCLLYFRHVVSPIKLSSAGEGDSGSVLQECCSESAPLSREHSAERGRMGAALCLSESDRLIIKVGVATLTVILVGYAVGAIYEVPVSLVAASGAVVVLAASLSTDRELAMRSLRRAPWQIVVFSSGMFLVVYGLSNHGLGRLLSWAIGSISGLGSGVAPVGVGLLSAVLSSVMNNLPATMSIAVSIGESHMTAPLAELLTVANAVGSDIGPKMTPIGSLATLLWMHILREHGIRIGWGQYFRVGMVLTPPVLILSLVALAAACGI